MDLKQLQQQFQDYIQFLDGAIEQRIVSTKTLSAGIRLEIYRDAYYARLHEALATDYPVLAFALGEQAFEQLSEAYVQAHPSHYRSINDFGQHLPGFLADSLLTQTAFPESFLQQLAELEWALVCAFNAESTTTISESSLSILPAEAWPGLCFSLHPSVQLLAQQWNVNAYWNGVKDKLAAGCEQSESAEGVGSAEVTCQALEKGEPRHSLVWRQGLITGFRSVDDMEAEALQGVMRGTSFAEMCDMISQHCGAGDTEQQAPMRAASLLKTWIGSELITELHY